MDRDTLDRIVKLLGMTGSDQDGEALNAVRAANKFLADRKLTWAGVFALIPVGYAPRLADPPPKATQDPIAEPIAFLWMHVDDLEPRERQDYARMREKWLSTGELTLTERAIIKAIRSRVAERVWKGQGSQA